MRQFQPLPSLFHSVQKTFGSFEPKALEILKSIASTLARETGDRHAGEYLRQRLNVAIICGNVALWFIGGVYVFNLFLNKINLFRHY